MTHMCNNLSSLNPLPGRAYKVGLLGYWHMGTVLARRTSCYHQWLIRCQWELKLAGHKSVTLTTEHRLLLMRQYYK